MPRVPRILALNKIDRLEGKLASSYLERTDYSAVIPISAAKGTGLDQLLEAVEASFSDGMVEINLTVPYVRGDLISLIHDFGVIDNERHTETGVVIRAHVPPRLLSRFPGYNSQ